MTAGAPSMRRHDGVREADHGADARVPGPLDEEHVVVRERAVRGEDPRPEVLDDVRPRCTPS